MNYERRRHDEDKDSEQSYNDYIEAIAEKAAEKAMIKLQNKMYQEVGQGVIKKLFWIIGIISVGLFLWLKGKGVV